MSLEGKKRRACISCDELTFSLFSAVMNSWNCDSWRGLVGV